MTLEDKALVLQNSGYCPHKLREKIDCYFPDSCQNCILENCPASEIDEVYGKLLKIYAKSMRIPKSSLKQEDEFYPASQKSLK